MIVAIASDDGVHVAKDPGRCGGFVVFEVEGTTTVRVGYRSNTCAQVPDAYGAGPKVVEGPITPLEPLLAALSDCGALIFKTFDGAVTRALQAGAISAYVCPESTVDQAAELFARGRLEKLRSEARGSGH